MYGNGGTLKTTLIIHKIWKLVVCVQCLVKYLHATPDAPTERDKSKKPVAVLFSRKIANQPRQQEKVRTIFRMKMPQVSKFKRGSSHRKRKTNPKTNATNHKCKLCKVAYITMSNSLIIKIIIDSIPNFEIY